MPEVTASFKRSTGVQLYYRMLSIRKYNIQLDEYFSRFINLVGKEVNGYSSDELKACRNYYITYQKAHVRQQEKHNQCNNLVVVLV